jgi:DNA-binding HxlR family transcriptional regulator
MSIELRSATNGYALRVVRVLAPGALRSNELSRRIDATNGMAFARLIRKMERDGLVTRQVKVIGPPTVVEYELTALGRSLVAPATSLADWVTKHNGDVERARAKYHVDAEAARAAELTT